MPIHTIRWHGGETLEVECVNEIVESLEAYVHAKGYEIWSVDYHFVTDEVLLSINQTHLDHDTYTDIITFDETVGKMLSLDIYISDERVRENARTVRVSLRTELARVMVHGILHAMGYKDSTEAQRTQMRKSEQEYLNQYILKKINDT